MMGPDGIDRTKADTEVLASHVGAVLKTPAGKKLFEYMKQVSTNRVMPVTGTSEALWHLEGMRHMVYLINFWGEYNNDRKRSDISGNGDGRNPPAKSKRGAARAA